MDHQRSGVDNQYESSHTTPFIHSATKVCFANTDLGDFFDSAITSVFTADLNRDKEVRMFSNNREESHGVPYRKALHHQK